MMSRSTFGLYKMIKVLCIFGTRPEAIKMAPVIAKLNSYPEQIKTVVCVTAQHREMLDSVLSVFDIQPDYDLDIMQKNQNLTDLTANLLHRLHPVLSSEAPDWVLVHGDTTTSMAASVAAFYQQIQVGHVEAGLRTNQKYNPFPEEINRKIVDHICDLHFVPTQTAKENLLREGFTNSTVLLTGNTVIDSLLTIANKPFDWDTSILAGIPRDKQIIVVTAHRRENFGQPLRNICEALLEIASQHHNVHIVFPVHLNPNVRQTVYQLIGSIPNITLTAPLEYVPFVNLLKQAYLVLTDSGGLQEEVPSLGIPVLVLRETTERPEVIASGAAKLVGTNKVTILQAVNFLLQNQEAHTTMSKAVNPFGDGHASERIVKALLGINYA